MSGALIVIPARYGSTRFPGKVLATLGGKPIVQWCCEAATRADVGPVLVATEDARVKAAVEAFGGKAVLTSPDCHSGTDRVYEAAKGSGAEFIINVQGDQPLIEPATIKAVYALLRSNPAADMSTAVMELHDEERFNNPNVVKAVLAKDGKALYFSRAPIPASRSGGAPEKYEHLGIYGFRRAALERFVRLPPSRLERVEMLEQLRALEDGMSLYAALVLDQPVAIDTPQDLSRAEHILLTLKNK